MRSSPAPTSNIDDNATSAITSALRKPPAATGALARAFFQYFVQIHARGPQRGEESEKGDAGDGNQHRKSQHAPIEPEADGGGKGFRNQVLQEREAPYSEQHSEGSSARRQQRALGKQLSYDAAPAGANGCPHGDFA